MKFQVPQFIEMDDKIFGPFSFKEFIYLLGGVGISYIIYRFVPFFYLAVILIIPVMSFSVALAVYRPNNKPFIDMVESALIYFVGTKLYIWKKIEKKSSPSSLLEADSPDSVLSLIHTVEKTTPEQKNGNIKSKLNIKI